MQSTRRIDTPIEPHKPTGIARSAAQPLASSIGHVRRNARTRS